ncbi:hypothetical protein K1719_012450 [Acacia pycnantha]|nr:hypothetical protein K1719_012450 [Acacia pycnantha]
MGIGIFRLVPVVLTTAENHPQVPICFSFSGPYHILSRQPHPQNYIRISFLSSSPSSTYTPTLRFYIWDVTLQYPEHVLPVIDKVSSFKSRLNSCSRW